MPPIRGALFVEGLGETAAAPRLMKRLWQHLELEPFVAWDVMLRNNNFKDDEYLRRQLDRNELRNGRYQMLVVMFDSDDRTDGEPMCPRDKGPATAAVLRAANLPIPSAVILPYQEYEHWFVVCLPQWAGRPVFDPATQREIARFVADTTPGLNRIRQRDGKGIIRDHLEPREYEPTTHQSALTAMLDLPYLCHNDRSETCDLVGFGPLRRACQFLAANIGQTGAVYPPQNNHQGQHANE